MLRCTICNLNLNSENKEVCLHCNWKIKIHHLSEAQLPLILQKELNRKVSWAKNLWEQLHRKQADSCESYLEKSLFKEAIHFYQQRLADYIDSKSRITEVTNDVKVLSEKGLSCPICSSKHLEEDNLCNTCRYPLSDELWSTNSISQSIAKFFEKDEEIELWGHNLWNRSSIDILGKAHFDKLCEYEEELNRYPEYLDYLNELLQLAQQQQKYIQQCDILGLQASYFWHNERYAKAGTVCLSGLKIADELNDLNFKAQFLQSLGYSSYNSNEYETAIDYYQQELETLKSLDNSESQVQCLHSLSSCYLVLNQFNEALEVNQQGLELAERLNLKQLEINFTTNLGDCHKNLKQHDLAIPYYQRLSSIFNCLGDLEKEAEVLEKLASQYISLEYFDKAIDVLEKAIGISTESNRHEAQVNYLSDLGLCFFRLEQYEQAIDNFNNVFEIARNEKVKHENRETWLHLGKCYRATQQYNQSIGILEQGLSDFGDTEKPELQYQFLFEIGECYQLLNESNVAISYIEKSLTIAERINNNKLSKCYSLSAIGKVYESIEQYDQAINYFQQAVIIAKQVGDRQLETKYLSNVEDCQDEIDSADSYDDEYYTPEILSPIPPPSHPRQYRAIGLIRAKYVQSTEQMTQGTLITTDGAEIEAVLLGRIISLIKNHLDLDKEHLWVAYPRTKINNDRLHVQITGVWEPENLSQDVEESPEAKHGYFSIRGEVIFSSTEENYVIVKIKQFPRKKGDKPKFFKLKLLGIPGEKPVKRFWDLKVRLEKENLIIESGTDLGFAQKRKPKFKKDPKKIQLKSARLSKLDPSARPIPNKKDDAQKSLTIDEQLGDRILEVKCLDIESQPIHIKPSKASETRQNIIDSEDDLEEELNSIQEQGDRFTKSLDLTNIADRCEDNYQIKAAIEYTGKALEICHKLSVRDNKAINRTNEAICLNKLGNLYRKSYQTQEAIQYLKKALNIYYSQNDLKRQGIVLVNLAIAYQASNKYQKAIKYNQKALRIFVELDDRSGIASAMRGLSNSFRSRGEYSKSLDYAQESLTIARIISDRQNEGKSLYELALCYGKLGQVQKAIEYNEQSLSIFKEFGDREEEALCLINLADKYYILSQYEKAEDLYRQSLATCQEIGDSRLEVECLNIIKDCQIKIESQFLHTTSPASSVAQKNIIDSKDPLEEELKPVEKQDDRFSKFIDLLKSAARCEDNYQIEAAIEYAEEALKACREQSVVDSEINDCTNEARCLTRLGELYRKSHQIQKAIEYNQKALAIYQKQEDSKGQGTALGHLAIAYRASNQYKQAIECDKQALSILVELGDRSAQANVMRGLSISFSSLGQYEISVDYAQEALIIAREIGDRQEEGMLLDSLSIDFRRLGQVQKAVEYSQQALLIFQERGRGICYGNLATCEYQLKKYQQALKYAERSRGILQAIGDLFQCAYHGYYIRGLILIKLDNQKVAIDTFIHAYHIFQSIKQDFWASKVWKQLNSIGAFFLTEKRFSEAIDLYNLQLQELEKTDDQEGIGWVLSSLGKVFYKQTDYERAIEYHQKSLSIAEELNLAKLQADSHFMLGKCYKSFKNYQKAISSFKLAIDIYVKSNDEKRQIETSKELIDAYGFYIFGSSNVEESYIRSKTNWFKIIQEQETLLKLTQNFSKRQILQKINIVFNLGYSNYFYRDYNKATENFKVFIEEYQNNINNFSDSSVHKPFFESKLGHAYYMLGRISFEYRYQQKDTAKTYKIYFEIAQDLYTKSNNKAGLSLVYEYLRHLNSSNTKSNNKIKKTNTEKSYSQRRVKTIPTKKASVSRKQCRETRKTSGSQHIYHLEINFLEHENRAI